MRGDLRTSFVAESVALLLVATRSEHVPDSKFVCSLDNLDVGCSPSTSSRNGEIANHERHDRGRFAEQYVVSYN